MGAYNGILEDLGLETVTDAEAPASRSACPRGVLGEPVIEPPFVRYEATDGSVAQLILISQPGDLDTLYGLYEIIQTLEVVPTEGPRERGERSFVIEGAGRDPPHPRRGDARRQRRSRASPWSGRRATRSGSPASCPRSTPRSAACPASSTRRRARPPRIRPWTSSRACRCASRRATASGFFVDGLGTVVTTAAAVASCERVTIDEATEARGRSRPTPRSASPSWSPSRRWPPAPSPRSRPTRRASTPRSRSRASPTAASSRGPSSASAASPTCAASNGEEEVRRLDLAARPGDAGGPVFDAGGAVLGMLLPAGDGRRGAARGGSLRARQRRRSSRRSPARGSRPPRPAPRPRSAPSA